MGVSSRLAFGEFKEHKKIYAIIIVVIALTMTSFMLENAYINYMMQVVDDTTKLTTSDAVIIDPSCNIRDIYGTEVELKNAGKIASEIEERLPGYTTSVRVTSQGSYAFDVENEAVDGCTIQGIDPKKDNALVNIKDKIVKGRFFEEGDPITRGHTPIYIQIEGLGNLPNFAYGTSEKMLEDEKPYPIIIGATVTKVHPSINVGKTFSVTISTSGRKTSFASVNVKVIGLYESGTPTLDTMIWFMHADSLREIKGYGEITGDDWYIPGVGTFRGYKPIEVDENRGDVVIVKAPQAINYLDPIGYSEGVKDTLEKLLPNHNIYTWHDFLVYIAGSMQDVVTIMLWGSIAVTLILCCASIKYVMDSIILRKTREIGSLKAFGARDRVIFKIFLYQGLIIGFIAGLIGIFLSIVVMNFVNWYGLNLEFVAGTQIKIGFIINWLTLLVSMLLPICLAVLAAAAPAKKASTLSPVEALRKGELAL